MALIEFTVNGIKCSVDAKLPRETTLNAYLRYELALPGTKAMCHEGGCGSCIVMVRAKRYPAGIVQTFSVNSCLVLVFSCHGWDITTVEGLGNRLQGYSDVQKRIVAFNGTQCGFCTPGVVMHLSSLIDKNLTMEQLENSFGSNTCRCTGFRNILDAIQSFGTDATPELCDRVRDIEESPCNKAKCCQRKCSIRSEGSDWSLVEDTQGAGPIVLSFGKHKFFKVFEQQEIFDILNQQGVDSYMFVDGNTGKGIVESFEYPRILIDISDVMSLKGYEIDQNLVLGANVSLEDCITIFTDIAKTRNEFSYLKEFVTHLELVAHIPVRKIGSLAGNLMYKKAIPTYQSDVYLLLECIGATITVREYCMLCQAYAWIYAAFDLGKKSPHEIDRGTETIEALPRVACGYCVSYGNCSGQTTCLTVDQFLKYDMQGKLMVNIELPPLSSTCLFRSYKIMPRNQNALAIVNAAFLIQIENSLVKRASFCFGNLSPGFAHASNTEQYVIGKNIFENATFQNVLKVLNDDLIVKEIEGEPSVECRKKLAMGLFYKFILNITPAGKSNSKYASGGNLISRPISKGKQDYQTDPSLYPLNKPIDKLEAPIQASGEAHYANDIPPMPREVFGAFILSTVCVGEVEKIDIEGALAIKGVVAVYTPSDIPGINSFSCPGVQLQTIEEEIIASIIKFHGQPIAILVAKTQELAARVAKQVKVTYKNISSSAPVLTIDDAKKDSKRYIAGDATINPTTKGNDTVKIVKGVYEIEAQYHYYMEPITCVVKPVDNILEVYDSTQWMDLTQIAISRSLGINESEVVVKVPRIGGGFGGKVSRGVQAATACALVAKKLNLPCRFILPLQTNLTIAGRRLPCQCDYEAGVDANGKIQYLNATMVEDKGCSSNESILAYTVEGFPNCYNRETWTVKSANVLTDLPSNSFARAPGTAEGISCIENIMEHIAFAIGKDPTEVRQLNMRTDDNDLPQLIETIKKDCNYDERVTQIASFNNANRWKKRAIKISVMCFPVVYFGNYTAMVSVYRGDGSVTVCTGGIEMGQGLNTKAAQVCAYKLGVPVSCVSVVESNSIVDCNDVFSGSSITTESVCYCIIRACEEILERLAELREKYPQATWKELIKYAGDQQISLSAEYMMADTDPNLHAYTAFAVAMVETELDVLTGRFQINRADILEDVGVSANPKLDVGQVQGAYVQGLGYFTCEKLVYDQKTGKLLSNRSLKYHVPLCLDIPVEFNVKLRYNAKNTKGVLGSKTCGEMGICTAHGVTHALRQCIMESRKDSGYDTTHWINIAVPYDTEAILKALDVKQSDFLIA